MKNKWVNLAALVMIIFVITAAVALVIYSKNNRIKLEIASSTAGSTERFDTTSSCVSTTESFGTTSSSVSTTESTSTTSSSVSTNGSSDITSVTVSKPQESTTASTSIDKPEKVLTFDAFLKMKPAEQQEYMNSYDDIMDFLEWYRVAEEKYKSEIQSTEIIGGNINIGDYIK